MFNRLLFFKSFAKRHISPRWAAASVLTCILLFLAYDLRLFEPLPLDTPPQSHLVLDRHGRILRAFIAEDGRWRFQAKPEDVSPIYLSMLFAFEDKRFWRHPGIDAFAFVRAAWQSALHGRPVSGGSTLTMQVARLLRATPTRSIHAKLQQIVDALRLEASLSKREILELYLARAPYGGNLEGVRAASLAYFGKEPKRLSLAEAAFLVALPQAPEARRPDRHNGRDDNGAIRGEAALSNARRRVIQRAIEAGVLKPGDGAQALAQSLPASRGAFPALAPHLAERLVQEHKDRLVFRTTLDRDLQASAEAMTRRQVLALGEKVSAAAIIIDNRTGDVLAQVGSAGYFDEARFGAIDMTAAVRSPGSALKPFIYGLAFEDGLAHPETLIEDRPVRFDTYAPSNFDKEFHGTVSIRQALQLSLNVPAVKVLNEVGPAKLASRFRDAGMPFTVPRNLTVALGGVGISLENLAALYVALARRGEVVPLRVLRDENPASVSPAAGVDESPQVRLLEQGAAWYVTDILRGAPAPNGGPSGSIAFKTGTSYGFRDAWAAGFDGEHTIAVWVGRADATPVPGISGLRTAAPLLFELFHAISPTRAPFAGPPPTILAVKKNSDLPPPLRVFHEQRTISPPSLDGPPPRIAYPPANAEVELGDGGDKTLAFKAEGGTLPLTWLVNGAPVEASPFRREARVENAGAGFVQVTVIDAAGRSDQAQFRVRLR